jgi:hypothetical protein
MLYSGPIAMTDSKLMIRWNPPTRGGRLAVLVACALLVPALCHAQIKAVARPGAVPPWNKGLMPINAESYYHAIECGKQGGEDPPCVFWDTGLCQNEDFVLAFYSAYKEVAYQVWAAVRKKQPAPQPSYQSARRTRVSIGVTAARGSKNTFTNLVLKRRGKAVPAVDHSISDGGGRFTFDYAAWTPTSSVTLELVGKTKTVACVISPDVLRQFR